MNSDQYDQDIQNTSGGAMDTSPLSQSSGFLASLTPSHPEPSLQNPLLQDTPTVFLNKPDLPNGMVASMHVSMPDLSTNTFMTTMNAIDTVPHLHTAPAGFISDFSPHPDPFSMISPLENAMSLEMSPNSHLSASPPQSQVPSPSIHGSAASYATGVTSSLESALDPAGVSGGRSRANTTISPEQLISSPFTSVSPSAQEPMNITFSPSDVSLMESEKLPQAQSLMILEEMLQDIATTASSAGNACRMRDGVEATSKVDELKERISRVSEMLAMMSVTRPDPTLSFSPSQITPTELVSPPPTLSPSQVLPLPQTLPLNQGIALSQLPSQSLPAAQVTSLPLQESISLGYPPPPASSVDLPGHLAAGDHPRKRCASELEEHRTVKALKREPQEDTTLLMPSIEPPQVAMINETSPLFPVPGPLPQTVSPLAAMSQSQPSSRPPTPPAFSAAHMSFSPLKQQGPGFPGYTPPASAPIDFPPSVPSPLVPTSPTFPTLHSSWSDSVVPSTRHHHSLSAGSVSGSFQTMSATAAIDPFSPPPPISHVIQPLALSPTAISGINPPLGRMSRSGSINGTSYSNNPYGYGYIESYSDTNPKWTKIARAPVSASTTSSTTPIQASEAPRSATSSNWYIGNKKTSASSASPSAASDAPSTRPSTTRNSPTDDEDDDDDDDSEENEVSPSKPATRTPSGEGLTTSSSDVPQEYRAEVDRIFFEYLNRICSNLDATDSKGEPIHQTLMAKKMQRLDESPDFRPFKFRIQAFTLAFLEELSRQGYPEDKIPMKKIRNYLWRQQYILRFNEDGKKAKSKGNHIWNIEAKKAGDGKWHFRPFYRKLAGVPPPVAYCGLKWSWTPHIWDPQASWQNVPVQYSSPSLPSWLSWNEDILSGVPPSDAESCQIVVNAQFVFDGQEGNLSHTFQLNIAPVSTIDASSFSRSRRPSLAGDPPRRSTSDSVLFQAPQRTKPRQAATVESPDTRVIRVLQSVAQRVTEEAESQFVSASPPKQDELQDLVKQKHVLEQTVDAYDKEISGYGHSQTRRLAVAAQKVVVQAAHTVIADRTAATGGTPIQQTETTAIQSVTVNELTDATQDAIAEAVKRNGTASTEVDIIVAATSILKARTTGISDPTTVTQSTHSHSTGIIPSRVNPIAATGFPAPNLSSLPEYG